jgi:hypothetical protein
MQKIQELNNEYVELNVELHLKEYFFLDNQFYKVLHMRTSDAQITLSCSHPQPSHIEFIKLHETVWTYKLNDRTPCINVSGFKIQLQCNKVKHSHYRPRGFWEVKASRFRDIGT